MTEPLTIGVDVGGTKISAGVVDADGQVLASARVESPATDSEAMEDAIAALVGDLRAEHEVAAVGIGAAGFVDRSRSTVLFAPNIAWRDEPLRAEIERRVDLPVIVENDGNAAAWAEFTFGAGTEVDHLLMVAVGTGVGGGVVIDGRLHRGACGMGAELGHLCLVPGGVECGCGNLGCLESYASGTALVRHVRTGIREDVVGARALLLRAGGDIDAVTGAMVTDAARDGERFAITALREVGHFLGEGIASLVAVLDPGLVVVGGGVADAGDLLLDPLRESLGDQLIGRGHRPEIEVRTAALGNTAGLVGAADLARRPD